MNEEKTPKQATHPALSSREFEMFNANWINVDDVIYTKSVERFVNFYEECHLVLGGKEPK